MVDVITFSKKIISVGYHTRYFMKNRLGNGSTYPEIFSVSVPFDDTIGLFEGLMFSLVALSISCVVLIKLPSVVCVLLHTNSPKNTLLFLDISVQSINHSINQGLCNIQTHNNNNIHTFVNMNTERAGNEVTISNNNNK